MKSSSSVLNPRTNIPVLAIDGPSGSGKGTISQLLAEKLQWHFLDSGALYRVLALAATKQGVDISDIGLLAQLSKNLKVEFHGQRLGQGPQVLLAGEDVTKAIRGESNGMVASKIAMYQPVRDALLARQRQFQQSPGLVADGRDMGTVVFPNAQVKIFLTASLEERANRRFIQLKQRGIKIDLEQILEEMTERDVRDKQRVASPSKPAADAVIIDTTHLTIEDVLVKILDLLHDKQLSVKVSDS